MLSISSITSAMMPAQTAVAKKPEAPRELQTTNPVDTFETQDGAVKATRFDMQVVKKEDQDEFREVFHRFIGTTMYGQMLKGMRQSQSKPAYFDGGRAEEMFQHQLDEVIVDKMTRATSKTMSDAMFTQMNRRTMQSEQSAVSSQ
jgi:hypothetical protein